MLMSNRMSHTMGCDDESSRSHDGRHWGRGPMETGVYMLGTLQALAESSSNVLTRYIPFAFQM